MPATANESKQGLFIVKRADADPIIAKTYQRALDALDAAIITVAGSDAAARLRKVGLGELHTVLDASDMGRLRDHTIEAIRPDLLRMATQLGRNLLGWQDEFYVDDYLILRINLPFDVACKASAATENPGIGRLSPSVRRLASSRRVIDPVYDPKGYHRGYPPAAWAHGPHVDSWAGHSRNGLNIWWAITDVPSEAGMVLYPELADKHPPCDRRTPTYLPLNAGEMLIFDPEILHGTHLNITQTTRVAISLRVNAFRPIFDPGCFYAREFWRRASDIERGEFDKIEHLRREDNLGPADEPGKVEIGPPRRLVQGTFTDGHDAMRVCRSEEIRSFEKITVEGPAGRLLVVRSPAGLIAFDAACPHYGLDLDDGGLTNDAIFCPGCGVKFCLSTGESPSKVLRLTKHRAFEENGIVWVEVRKSGSP